MEKKVDAGDTDIQFKGDAEPPLTKGDWIWVEGNPGNEKEEADLVRISGPVKVGKKVLVAPPFTAPHDEGREIRKVTYSIVDSLEKKVDAGATIVRLKGSAATPLTQGHSLWIESNPGQQKAPQDLVMISEPMATGKEVTISPSLRFLHDSGRGIHKVILSPPGPNSFVIHGGLVVPLYVVILSLIGAAVSMTRRVPEYQMRTYLSSGAEGYLPKENARELLVLQIMQVFSAPLIAIAVYHMVKPEDLTTSILLGFASGFASETILRTIRALVNKLNPAESLSSTTTAPSTVPETHPPPDVVKVIPPDGLGGSKNFLIKVSGTGFQVGATVRLIRESIELNPKPKTIKVKSEEEITARFDLPERPTGKWDVNVINPDHREDILPEGFEIKESSPTDESAETSGSPNLSPKSSGLPSKKDQKGEEQPGGGEETQDSSSQASNIPDPRQEAQEEETERQRRTLSEGEPEQDLARTQDSSTQASDIPDPGQEAQEEETERQRRTLSEGEPEQDLDRTQDSSTQASDIPDPGQEAQEEETRRTDDQSEGSGRESPPIK